MICKDHKQLFVVLSKIRNKLWVWGARVPFVQLLPAAGVRKGVFSLALVLRYLFPGA